VTTSVTGLSLLAGGCAEANVATPTLEPYRACGTLNNFNAFGPSKAGGENAVNIGACVEIYDPKTYQNIGQLAAGEVFVIRCEGGPKPLSYEISTSGNLLTGMVDLGGSAYQNAASNPRPDTVPEC